MKSVHHKNKWEVVTKIVEDYQSNSPIPNRPFQLLNEAYSAMYPESNQALENSRDRARLGDASPLDTLLLLVGAGIYPPPELLLWLDECFHCYYQVSGEVSLEHIFFGREKPRIGNESRRRASSFFYSGFSSLIRSEEYLAKNEKREVRSKSELAEEYLSTHWTALKHLNDKELDAESFLRSWRRWRSTTDK